MKLFEQFKCPGIGMRNIKTVLATAVCMTVYALLGHDMPFYACIAAVICMQDTVQNTVRHGFSRLLGTLTGGVIGIIFLLLSQLVPYTAFMILLCAVGVSLTIYLGVVINRPLSCTISSTVFLVIMLTNSGDQPFIYAINRIVETAFGVAVAVLINRLINPRASGTDGGIKWSWKIARTDLEEWHNLQRLHFHRDAPLHKKDKTNK